MGQNYSEPIDRIPLPTSSTILDAMNHYGIIIHEEPGVRYFKYTLPPGWRAVDESSYPEFIRFHLVDDKNMVHFTISNVMKGVNYNGLELFMLINPYQLKIPEYKVIL